MECHNLKILREKLAHALSSISTFSSTAQTRRTPIIQPDGEFADGENEIPGLRAFESSVKREIESLDKFLGADDVTSSTLSTNAPYYLDVWSEVLYARPPVLSIGRNFTLPVKHGGRAKPSVKVDVVADDGYQWIRVNTIKNSRLMAELREIDSYVTEDDSSSKHSDEDETATTFAAVRPVSELDNSVLRMGRTLLDAAAHNPVLGTSEVPSVHLRLTRLDPSDGSVIDPRIRETVDKLREMGIVVELGERPVLKDGDMPSFASCSHLVDLIPTLRINLDLSLIIALVSDLSHSMLPTSSADAVARFRTPNRRWKNPMADSASDDDSDLGEHSRALATQAQQEMRRGLMDEILDRLTASYATLNACMPPTASPSFNAEAIEFWATSEARDRCLSIVNKIGGPGERRRARALFSDASSSIEDGRGSHKLNEFWEHSRYPMHYLPGLPIRIFPQDPPLSTSAIPTKDSFLTRLLHTCRSIMSSSSGNDAGTDPAIVKPVSPRLTPHTVGSLLMGAAAGMTTLTANKASVKAILREMRTKEAVAGDHSSPPTPITNPERSVHDDDVSGRTSTAWIWVVEPRSLAENMRADCILPSQRGS